MSLAMYRGSDDLPSGGVNRYLFLKAQDGVHDHAVQGESTYQFDFAEDDIPSVTVTGVWFNGRTYVEVNYGYQIRFNPAERGLHVEISPDQERYAPGDEARLEITVTDENRDAQPNTAVNISVVDEALFLIQGARSDTDLLADMYVPVSPGILRTYASHQYPNDYAPPGFGATTGGGPRTQFADVAFYGSVTTDGDGHASVSFELPDNLTSWRVTAQGFNDRIMAGTALRKIPVGLPFFADVTLSDEYLVTDRPEGRLRSFGGALEAGDEVTFSVSAPSLGLDTPLEITAPAFQAARVALPELREGEHEILIEARSGVLEDSLVRKIRVVPSRLVSAQTRFYELQRGLRVEGSDSGPTRIAFSDHERGRYFGMLQQLTWGYGDRLDQMLARDVAAELLATFYDDVEVPGEPFEASIYQTPEGGIALFPYAGQDLTLSARAAAVAPDRFGSAALTRHFLGVLQDRGETLERQVIALYGLAALGEPVLLPLQTLLRETDLAWRERLYAGLAFVEVGDDRSAGAVYQGLIDDYGESTSPTYRLRVGEDQDDILEAT
ncbi:MAG: alpha-2-macroglobulin family protein, partial [Longimicrobiales bacterium]